MGYVEFVKINGFIYGVCATEIANTQQYCPHCKDYILVGQSLTRLEAQDLDCKNNKFPKFHGDCFPDYKASLTEEEQPKPDLKPFLENAKPDDDGEYWDIVQLTGSKRGKYLIADLNKNLSKVYFPKTEANGFALGLNSLPHDHELARRVKTYIESFI